MTAPTRTVWRGRILALVAIVLFAFSLRTAVASLSPVMTAITAEFPVSAVVAGLIGTAPPVCFAIFGFFTPALERRLGLEKLAVITMLVATVGLAARALAWDATSLLVSTAIVFAAVGVGNVMLPPLVKMYFPDRIGTVSMIYTTALALSTFLPPALAVPVADAAGWRWSLALWAVFAAVAVVPWILLVARDRRKTLRDQAPETPSPQAFGRMWSLPLAWALLVGFAVSGIIAYVSFAWLPQMLMDLAGLDAATAGSLLGLFAAMGLPSSLLVPVLVVRFNATRVLFGVAIVSALLGTAGLLFAPTVAPWLWAPMLGLGNLLFPLSLVLLGLRVRTHDGAVALSSFVQSIGYAIVALFPFGIGILHDVTGSWTVSLWVLAAAVATAIPAGVIAARPHTIEEDWERRHQRAWA